MNWQSALGAAAGVLALIQAVPYIASIVWGSTRPSRTAYGIWSVAEIVSAWSYLKAGASTTAWLYVATAITAVAIFAISLWRGMDGTSRQDLVCLALSAAAVVLWVVSGDPVLAVYCSLGTTCLAYVPLVRKSWRHPGTENLPSWGIYLVAATLNVLAVASLQPAILLPPVVALAGAAFVCWALVRGRLAAGATPNGLLPLHPRSL